MRDGQGRRGTTRPATAPRRFKRGRKLKAPVPILITSFKAEGSIRQLAHQIYGGYRDESDGPRYGVRKRRFAELQRNHPDGYPQSPGIWVSNEGTILGTVNFAGYVKLQTLFNMLNKQLRLDTKEITRHRYELKRVRNKRTGRIRIMRKRVSYPVLKEYAKAADFRDVYKRWSWKWQVVEVPVVPQARMKDFRNTPEGKPRVIISKAGASR